MEDPEYTAGYDAGYDAALEREGIEPDQAFLKLVMDRLELRGDFWRVQVTGAMLGYSGCAAKVIAYCEKEKQQ